MADVADLSALGAKVSISPDKMRAWVILPRPPKGAGYTAGALTAWLPVQGVTHGVSAEMVKDAVNSGKYDDLLEVARGTAPVEPVGAGYTLCINKKPFTGLPGNSDGSLYYDDLSFLQEANPGDVLAELTPGTPGKDGMDVTGTPVPPRKTAEDSELKGSGFALRDDGFAFVAPGLSHVGVVNGQLMVTPLLKLAAVSPEDGEVSAPGNILVEGNVAAGSKLKAGGSVFVKGRCDTCDITAGHNVLVSGGVRSANGFSRITASSNVWGMCFEGCTIKAGGDICANHLRGCEVDVEGRASILGGAGQIGSSTVYAKNGIIAQVIGQGTGDNTVVKAGMGSELFERQDALARRMEKLSADIQALGQSASAFERINRNRPDKGRSDPAYKDMVKRRDQQIGVLNILNTENTRLKRTMEQFAAVNIIARDKIFAGVEIVLDTRRLTVAATTERAKFRRVREAVELVSAAK